ncbi:MAG TPA: aromatic-ring-hydroxylating dioxygenase subunit beta [Xanthobacteraceae bacterium]|jgi:anthranilate 1,2-dioxygenase small subunit/terephthalate 1,2-dioxygenase oxygenase component beta subunit|nr:aromatic-ring-hydroxylating dioxygenase subunit beta [Xanthobacteraceae bacterium]
MDTGAGPQGAAIESQLKLQDLNARYVEAIDEGRFEDWPDFFMEKCKYRITTAENVEQGLPLSIIYATSRAMLRDRVKALREANVYEAQRYRHVLGPPRLVPAEAGGVGARTNFMVARVMHTGETALFATGRYLDQVVLAGGAALFAEKTVILDSRQIDTLLAIPL